MKIVIVVDMQNDFIDMALGTKEAQEIVDPMIEYFKYLDYSPVIIATRDTHQTDYLYSNEGKHLPVLHCIEGSIGWQINSKLEKNIKFDKFINKPNFGISAENWKEILAEYNVEEITLMGLCTDICVISNALALKTAYPEIPVKVVKNLCAGVTKETHEAALKTMQMCQVDLV